MLDKDLLEQIAFHAISSDLISDLKTSPISPAYMQVILRKINPTDFPLRQWQDAVEYLTGRSLPAFETEAEAHKYLVNFYRGQWAWDI